MWEQRAEEHIRAADFCHEQATRFLARVAVPDDYRPTLVLIAGDGGTKPDNRTEQQDSSDYGPDLA